MKFNYCLPVNLIFGRGRLAELGNIAASYGSCALLVTGGSSTKKTGVLERVLVYLKAAGMTVELYDKVTPNPLTQTAAEGVKILKEKNCGLVIGLGGGSVMDCAKAIAFLGVNDGDISDYIFNRLYGTESIPCILVPTTCGTGSEGNGFAVLTNPETGDKKSLRTNLIIPKASIIDSELMETMPSGVLAAVGFDALCHCMEAYLSKNSQPLVQYMCLSAIDLISRHLEDLYEGRTSDAAWDGMAWASALGGMVIHLAGVTLPHGMEHPASGLKNIVHGEGLSALTPVITEASISGAPMKYASISRHLGGSSEKDCADVLRRLIQKLNLPTSLAMLGIEKKDILWMSDNCFRVSQASIENHPVKFEKEGIIKLYEEAMQP